MPTYLDLVFGLYKPSARPSYGNGNACQVGGMMHKSLYHFKFSSFFMREVFLFFICLVLCAIEFFERSIECLYSFFSKILEESNGDVSSV
jgi:hypothetical protein